MTSLALQLSRSGQSVRLVDKIPDFTSVEELEGMHAACADRGRVMTTDEMKAFRDRRRELTGGK